MSRLIETICLQDGEFNNLSFHAARMERAWTEIFRIETPFVLEEILHQNKFPEKGLYKCRLLYDTALRGLAFTPYKMREVRSLKIVHDNTISYPHKFEDRSALDDWYSRKGTSDDILIIRQGQVTDCSYANIAFKKGNQWVTPISCLLKGTMRESLIVRGLLKEIPIGVKEIHSYETFRLINAMLRWEAPEIETSHIQPPD